VTASLTHEPYALITYSLTHLSQTEKVKFYYALKGRGNAKGLLADTSAFALARSVFMVRAAELQIAASFMETWGCHYVVRRAFLSPDQLGNLYAFVAKTHKDTL